MPLGDRHFVVVGDDITGLSQAFQALFAAMPRSPGVREHHGGPCHRPLCGDTDGRQPGA